MIYFGRDVWLGPLCRENLGLYRAERNDWEIWKWCRQNDVISQEAHERWFARQDADPKIRMYEIMDKLAGPPVGVCGLTDIDHVNQRAEFSLYVFAAAQGNGIGRAALETLISHGFSNLNLCTIWGETFDKNPALKMFLNLGFTKEGTRRNFYYKDGKFIDAHLVSITRKEWRLK